MMPEYVARNEEIDYMTLWIGASAAVVFAALVLCAVAVSGRRVPRIVPEDDERGA